MRTDAPALADHLGVLFDISPSAESGAVLAPGSLTSTEASTLPIAALTAWMALVELGHVHAGQTVVVQGTGGVSLFAVQLAAANGAKVIITSSSDDKIARAIEFGASHGINRTRTPAWETPVLELTGAVAQTTFSRWRAEKTSAASPGQWCRRSNIDGRPLESGEFSLPILPFLGSRAAIVGISAGPRRALEDLGRALTPARHQARD